MWKHWCQLGPTLWSMCNSGRDVPSASVLPEDMMQSSSLLSVLWVQACLCLVRPDGLSQGVGTPQQCYLHPKARDHGRTTGKGKLLRLTFLMDGFVNPEFSQQFKSSDTQGNSWGKSASSWLISPHEHKLSPLTENITHPLESAMSISSILCSGWVRHRVLDVVVCYVDLQQ